MRFSRQEYLNGLPCPPPGDLPDPGIEPMSLKSPALTGGFFTTSGTWEVPYVYLLTCKNINNTFYVKNMKSSEQLLPEINHRKKKQRGWGEMEEILYFSS